MRNSGGWEIRGIREIREFREIRGNREIRRLGKIVISCRSTNRWQGKHMGCQRIGKLGDWRIQETGRFRRLGNLGESGNSGDSEDWDIRERGNFGRVGNSVQWEIREIGKNPLGTPKDSGVRKTREIRSFERSEELGDSGDFGENHYIWRKLRTSLNARGFGRLGNCEIGKLGSFGSFGGFGKSIF